MKHRRKTQKLNRTLSPSGKMPSNNNVHVIRVLEKKNATE